MNKTTRAIAGAVLLAASGFAAAANIDANVDAKNNSIVGGTAVNAFTLLPDTTFSVTATGTWQNDPAASYLSGPDGHVDQTFTFEGVTFDIGALVGEIGDGSYFQIGSSYTGNTGAGGDLKLFYWDSDAFNNAGAVTATVSSIPEPANLALLGLALGAFALTRRRKA